LASRLVAPVSRSCFLFGSVVLFASSRFFPAFARLLSASSSRFLASVALLIAALNNEAVSGGCFRFVTAF